MNYNNFGRSRSPAPPQPPPHYPYGYDGPMRPISSHREFDDPYHPANPYDGPGRPPAGHISHSPLPSAHPNQMAPPMALHPYMEVPAHHQNYPPHYREQPPYGPPHIPPPPPSSSYRSAIAHRDTFINMGPSHPPLPPRSSSPPYKILCVTNINHKISDGPVKDALTSDFSRFGDISVSVCHDNGERLAYIYFRNCDEAREARQIKTRTLLFDKPIEIEPIYEPQLRGSPGNISPTGGPNLPRVYSPRRRSVSPPVYPRANPNVPLTPSRRPTPLDVPPTPPGYPSRRGSTPPDYGSGPGGHPNRPSPPSPPLPPAYDRRGGGYPYPPAHYSSPPHDPSRPAYPMPYPSSGYGRERDVTDRMQVASRSPYRDPNYPPEYRGGPPPPPHHQHYPDAPPPPPPLSTSRARRRSRSGRRSAQIAASDPYREERVPVRHRYPPDPPARYMSREFRREKFGSDPYPGDHDEGRPSRVLLVNNIDATKTDLDLKELFEPFGTIDEIEMKKVASECSSALVKFTSMDGAYKAKTANNGRHIGATRCRIVYGKVSASRRLWIGGLSPSMTVPMMEDECGKYGDIVSMDYTSGRPYCYVEYESANQAQFAAFHMRTILTPASERKIRIEFVDPDRSEKLLPRRSSNSQPSDANSNSKPRTATESTCDVNASPHSSGGLSGRKRSVSPASDLSISKRTCQQNELPLAANTFKQERLVAAAAAAAKARTSSTTSSTASQPSLERAGIKIGGDTHDGNELNNNSDSDQILVADGNPRDKLSRKETYISQEAPSLELLSQCSTMRDVVSCCSVSWPSQIGLRNFIFPAQIYMCSGSKSTIDAYLSRPMRDYGPLLRITQRWRLQPQSKLEEVQRRMQAGNLGILIIAARRENPSADRQVSSVQAPVSSDSPAVEDNNEMSGQQVALPTCENHPSGNQLEQNGPVAQENGKLNNESQQSATIVNETANAPMDRCEDGLPKSNNPYENSAPLVGNSVATSGSGAAVAEGPSTPNHAGTPPTPNVCTQSRPLRNLISYLEQKDAAGVISLIEITPSEGSAAGAEHAHPAAEAGSVSSTKLLYAFPPSDFALNLLRSYAPNLLSGAAKDEFLLGVIVSGNVESGKI